LAQAYILLQTEVGRAARVAREVALIPGVVSAQDVTGPYDVIARVEAPSAAELASGLISRLKTLSGVTRTITCPIVEPTDNQPTGSRS
jgi:DNA-binding Lrp family transcriptional regulator